MVQKCANPLCSEPFLHFSSGKIYRVDQRDTMRAPCPQREGQKVEHFWLCGECFPRLRVVMLRDGSVAVTEACLDPRDEPLGQSHSSRTTGSVGSTCARQRQERENNSVPGCFSPAAFTTRILVLDVELNTLAFIEEMLQDSGLSAITCRSVVEAVALLATGFFDVFVMMDRPAESHTGGTLSVLATASVHCEVCFCWRVDNIKQRCKDFVEQVVEGELRSDHDDHSTRRPPRPEQYLSVQQSSGATA